MVFPIVALSSTFSSIRIVYHSEWHNKWPTKSSHLLILLFLICTLSLSSSGLVLRTTLLVQGILRAKHQHHISKALSLDLFPLVESRFWSISDPYIAILHIKWIFQFLAENNCFYIWLSHPIGGNRTLKTYNSGPAVSWKIKKIVFQMRFVFTNRKLCNSKWGLFIYPPLLVSE